MNDAIEQKIDNLAASVKVGFDAVVAKLNTMESDIGTLKSDVRLLKSKFNTLP